MGLRSHSLSQSGEGCWELWPRHALEKEGGREEGTEGGGCGTGSGAAARGLGAMGVGEGRGLWSEGSKEEEKSEQGSRDIVLGGCGPEWAKSI